MINLTNITKIYRTGEVALNDVSLTIDEGEIFGIMGKSGAGKSTMIKLIGMLDTPTSGEIKVFGEDVNALKLHKRNALRKKIGTVFQGYNLLMQRNAAKNIAFPLELAPMNERLDKKTIKTRCEEMAELVGLSEKLKAYPASLSGGQKQRVAIARALATNPKILLCDEPTSALDSFTSKEILRLIKDINTKLGMTIVIISHDINVIRAVCDKAAILDGGKVIEMGEVSKIFDNPQNPIIKNLMSLEV